MAPFRMLLDRWKISVSAHAFEKQLSVLSLLLKVLRLALTFVAEYIVFEIELLDISYNLLSGMLPTAIGGLTKLRELLYLRVFQWIDLFHISF